MALFIIEIVLCYMAYVNLGLHLQCTTYQSVTFVDDQE